MKRNIVAALLCGAGMAACATPDTQGPAVTRAATQVETQKQYAFVVERRLGEMRRIYDVAARVKLANVAACPAKAPWLGASFATVDDFGRDFREAAASVVSDRPEPIWIAPTGPAARAGLRMHDRLLAVNGEAIPAGKKASETAWRDFRKGLDAGPVTLRVERDGAPVELVLPREETCGYDIVVEDSAEANAYADGRDIHVLRGILKAVESDDELALVLSHELAHNTMGHIGKEKRNAMIGALAGAVLDVAAASAGGATNGVYARLGAQITAGAYAKEFEAEADYVGMYYLAQAGYRLDGVEAFWRRMAAENPKQIKVAGTHPSFAARYVAIEATRAEIEQKVRAGQPLQPNPKHAPAGAAAGGAAASTL